MNLALNMFETILMRNLQASVIIAVIVVISLLFGKKLSVKARFFIWFLPIIRLLAPALPATKYALLQSSETLVDQVFVGGSPAVTSIIPDKISSAPTHMSLAPTFMEVLCWIWIVGITVFFGYMLVSNIIFYLKIRKIGTHNGIGITDLVNSPVTVGLFKTKIFLSSHNNLSDEQKELVIAHEKAHIKRKDLWLYLFLNVLCCVFWFNPFIWYLSIRIKQDAELLCDGEVLKKVDDEQKMLYGNTIINILRSSLKTPSLRTAAGIVGGKSHVKSRIKMIADFSKKSYKFSVLGVAIFLLAGCVSLTNNIPEAVIPSPMPIAVPDFVQERLLEYTYSFQGAEYSDRLLTSGQKGKFDLFKVLKILNIGYEVKDGRVSVDGFNIVYPKNKDETTGEIFIPTSGSGSFILQNKYVTITVSTDPKNNSAYLYEAEVLGLLRDAKDLLPYKVSIDEKNKRVFLVNVLETDYPLRTQVFDITYELGNAISLIYDKDTSTIIVGAFSQELEGDFIDGKITIANPLPENDDMSIELWDGKSITTIPLKISEVVK